MRVNFRSIGELSNSTLKIGGEVSRENHWGDIGFIDIEVNSDDIKLYLAKLYIDRGEFLKAIKLLFDCETIRNSRVWSR